MFSKLIFFPLNRWETIESNGGEKCNSENSGGKTHI
jgi:hypothetical protein